MARTITLDGATLHEIRIVPTPTGQTAVQVTFSLLSGSTVVQRVNLHDVTAQLQSGELAAANTLLAAINAALQRVELS